MPLCDRLGGRRGWRVGGTSVIAVDCLIHNARCIDYNCVGLARRSLRSRGRGRRCPGPCGTACGTRARSTGLRKDSTNSCMQRYQVLVSEESSRLHQHQRGPGTKQRRCESADRPLRRAMSTGDPPYSTFEPCSRGNRGSRISLSN